MKLAIMQPYFLPYKGYFDLIAQTDKFIVFDTAQFIRHGWIERNRIKSSTGEQYISVPLIKHGHNTAIKDIKIRDEEWQEKILKKLTYYKKSPKYQGVLNLLTNLYYPTDSLSKLNTHLLKAVCEHMGIKFDYEYFSEMDIDIKVNAPDEWALEICKALNADTYYNLPGGRSFFNKEKYDKAGIDLRFVETEPGLSIIDYLL